MKTLDRSAICVLESLLQLSEPLTDTTDGVARQVKATIAQDFGRYRIIYLTFFRYEDDFQMRDPEITIIHDTLTDDYIPSNICNDFDNLNSNSANLIYGELSIWNEKVQADHTEIANNLLEKLGEL